MYEFSKNCSFGSYGSILPPNWAQTIKFLIFKICFKNFSETCTMMNHYQYKKITDMNFPKKFWFGPNWPFLPQYLGLETVHLSILKSTLMILAPQIERSEIFQRITILANWAIFTPNWVQDITFL